MLFVGNELVLCLPRYLISLKNRFMMKLKLKLKLNIETMSIKLKNGTVVYGAKTGF